MKKTIVFILCLVIGLSTAACGKKKEQEKSVYQIGETVTLRDWELTVTDVSFTANEKDPEKKCVKVYCTVKNVGKEKKCFCPAYSSSWEYISSKLLYGDGYEYKVSSEDRDLSGKDIIPLSSASGYLQFIVPEIVADSQEELSIQFSYFWDRISFQLR